MKRAINFIPCFLCEKMSIMDCFLSVGVCAQLCSEEPKDRAAVGRRGTVGAMSDNTQEQQILPRIMQTERKWTCDSPWKTSASCGRDAATAAAAAAMDGRTTREMPPKINSAPVTGNYSSGNR